MAAIPRLASTVILMDDKSRIYLTKRPETMKFMGGFYVFPGGSLEESDKFSDRIILENNKVHSFHHSHYIAAARELFEEVGVFLGGRDDGSRPLFKKSSELEYRRRLINGTLTLLDLLYLEDLNLHLDSMQYFGHMITPESSPIRFDTRFFLAHLPKCQTPQPDEKEIDDAFWITPAEAIEAYQEKKILLAPVTLASLQGIYNYQQGGPLKMAEIQKFRL